MRYKSCQSLLCPAFGQDRQGRRTAAASGFLRPVLSADTAPPFLWACFDRKRQADDTSVSAVRYDFHPAIRTGCDGVYHPGIAAHCPVVGRSLNCRLGIVPVFHGCRGRKDRARPPFCPADRSDAGAECSGSYPTGRILISPPESRAVQGAHAATGTLARRVSLRPGARFSDTESRIRRSVSYLLSDARYTRNPAAARERMPLPELLPGGDSFRPGARFSDTESRVRRSVLYLLSDTRYSRNSGIPLRHGSGCRYRNSCPASFAPARARYSDTDTKNGVCSVLSVTSPFPEVCGLHGSGCRY